MEAILRENYNLGLEAKKNFMSVCPLFCAPQESEPPYAPFKSIQNSPTLPPPHPSTTYQLMTPASKNFFLAPQKSELAYAPFLAPHKSEPPCAPFKSI